MRIDEVEDKEAVLSRTANGCIGDPGTMTQEASNIMLIFSGNNNNNNLHKGVADQCNGMRSPVLDELDKIIGNGVFDLDWADDEDSNSI